MLRIKHSLGLLFLAVLFSSCNPWDKTRYVEQKFPIFAPDMETLKICDKMSRVIKEDVIKRMNMFLPINGENNLKVMELMDDISKTIYCDIRMKDIIKKESQ